jgi:serine/threonine-protein kinase
MLDRERELVEAKPTENLLAYETYLRGINYLLNAGAVRERWGKAETLLQQTVELDPRFALAWANLSIVHSEHYFWGFDRTAGRLEKAKAAAEKALELDPDLPSGHSALGGYYYMGHSDFEKALHYHSIAARGMPNNPKEIESIAYIWRRQGLVEEALEYLEKAAVLAPGQYWYPMQLGITTSMMRRYAVADRYLEQSIELEPDQVASYAMRWLNMLSWTGDVSRARAILESVPAGRRSELSSTFYKQCMLERDPGCALEVLSTMPRIRTNFFDRDIEIRDLLEGFAYMMMGDTSTAQARFDSARVILEEMARDYENDVVMGSSISGALGQAYACLGRKNEAIREGQRSFDLIQWDKMLSSYAILNQAEIYVLIGEYDAAMDRLEDILSVPSVIGISLLEVSPKFDPLRELPRYRRIVREYTGKGDS